MELTLQTFFIVCPMLFLAGLVDSIGGGGGLISLPAYLLAGVPVHQAVATNKLSSSCGTALVTFRFIKNKLINFKLGVPSVVAAVLGSSIGANISLAIEEAVMEKILSPSKDSFRTPRMTAAPLTSPADAAPAR